MAIYTELSEAEIEEILQYYAIGSLWTYKSVHGGLANTVYYVSTFGGEYILTVCDYKQANEVRLRTELVDHLYRSGLSVPRVVATKDKTPFVFFRDLPVIIKEYIPGSIVQHPNTDILFTLGVELAKIHTTQLSFKIPYRIPYDAKNFLQAYRTDEYFAKWIIDKTRYLENYIPKDAPIGLIHGDLFNDNYIVHNNQVKAIIDFEEACQFFLAYDLAVAIIGNCFQEESINDELAKSFIQGYETIRTITPLEKNNFHYFISYAASSLAYWRFKQFQIIHPNQAQQLDHKIMMNIADSYESPFSKSLIHIW